MLSLIKLLEKAISSIILSIPRPIQLLGGKFIGILWFDVLRIRRKIVLDNIRLAYPEWDEKKVIKTGRRSLCIVGQNICDIILLPFFNKSWVDKYFEVVGFENIEGALKKNRGVLFLGLHLGSGDLSVAALSSFGVKLNLISKEFKSKTLNRFWFSVRGRHGTKFIAPRRSSFDILKALKKNEVVIFVLDQFMGPPLGIRTKFFGHEAGTAMGLALIAGRTKAPVISCHTYIRDDGKSVMVFGEEIPYLDQGQRDKSISYMTQAYTDKIEEIVRMHPDQWLWLHRRWKEFRD